MTSAIPIGLYDDFGKLLFNGDIYPFFFMKMVNSLMLMYKCSRNLSDHSYLCMFACFVEKNLLCYHNKICTENLENAWIVKPLTTRPSFILKRTFSNNVKRIIRSHRKPLSVNLHSNNFKLSVKCLFLPLSLLVWAQPATCNSMLHSVNW